MIGFAEDVKNLIDQANWSVDRKVFYRPSCST